ncbi:unnamed protein product [Heligmosomoides polygyrus]|uniref:Rx_N domain-containing protein n=1 Tax=Heligmosomoides polygyrus TaxID=6339 RepID=A0A183F3J4_HELPZ|nr:unnamed protein product [Heligmosomoides polygyrus]
MRVTLVGLADAVKALAQRLKQVLQTIDSLLNLENMPATVPENLDQWSRAAAKKMTTVAPSVREYILLECGAISVELGHAICGSRKGCDEAGSHPTEERPRVQQRRVTLLLIQQRRHKASTFVMTKRSQMLVQIERLDFNQKGCARRSRRGRRPRRKAD